MDLCKDARLAKRSFWVALQSPVVAYGGRPIDIGVDKKSLGFEFMNTEPSYATTILLRQICIQDDSRVIQQVGRATKFVYELG